MSQERFSEEKSLEPEVRRVSDPASESPLLKVTTPWIYRGWPTAPGTVKPSWQCVLLEVIVDVILFALSVSFFAFAATVRYFDQKPTEDHPKTTKALIEATKYGPSVFPILFACVVGRAAQAILLWRLEKGERMGVLDMLAGSTSLTSTVTSQLQLRILNWVGLILIIIWALSPVGGQASFRQMSVGTRTDTHPGTFTYMKFSGNVWPYQTSAEQSYIAIVGSLFVSSILAPPSIKAAPVDLWKNVKIPMIEWYEKHAGVDNEGWFTVDQSNNIYSSLVGIPIADIDGSAMYSVDSLETEYLRLKCPIVYNQEAWTLSSYPKDAYFGSGCAIWSGDNMTTRYNAGTSVATPRQFTYVDHGATGRSTCDVTTTYVEAKISCGTGTVCAVSSIRRSRRAHPPQAYTLLDRDPEGWEIFANMFAKSLSGHYLYPTTVQTYLTTPNNPLGKAIQWEQDYQNETLPSKETYEIRLGQLMNSHWTIMNALYAITGGMTPATAWMKGTSSSMTIYDDALANATTTTGTTSRTFPVIECHTAWYVTLTIASLVTVIASLVHPVFRFSLTTAPDIMLNLSSLATKNNPCLAAPSNGTYMSASDRARLLKNVKVRLGDVEPRAGVGTLAIASLDPPGAHEIARVHKDRKYI